MRPRSSGNNRTRSPTVTSSSTIAVRMWGGDTAASTPHCSVKSHSLSGWLTRASTRGTPYSCLARSDVTRLSSSSPVTATTTSAVPRSAFSSTHGSQASPSRCSTSGAHSRAVSRTSGFCSMSVIVRPRLARSDARCRPTAPAPLITTRTSVVPRRRQELVEQLQGVLLDDDRGEVALLERAGGDRDEPSAPAVHAGHEDLAFDVERGDLLAHQMLRNLDPHPEQVAGRQRLLDLLARVAEHHHHLLDPPPCRGHGGDVQALVDVGASGVVDPGDHLGYVVVLARDPGGHDVRVVSARDGEEGVGLLDTCLLEDLPVEPEPDDLLGLEAGGETVERGRVLVDHGHLVAGLRQLLGEEHPHPATAHDHDAHGLVA